MGNFAAIVQGASHFAALKIAQFLHRRRIGTQPVGDDLLGLAMPLQRLLQEPQSRRFVAFSGDVGFQDPIFVIDGTPEIVHLAVDVGYAALRVT